MRLVILVGLPASGKSTWAQEKGLPVLSSDAVRQLLTGDPTHQGVNRLVFRTLRQLAAARMEAGMPVTLPSEADLAADALLRTQLGALLPDGQGCSFFAGSAADGGDWRLFCDRLEEKAATLDFAAVEAGALDAFAAFRTMLAQTGPATPVMQTA